MQTDQPGAGLGARPVVGVLHPGAMGASLGAALRGRSGQVIWAAAGRSDATAKRAELADLVPVRDVAELVARADVVVSICPPAAALELAEQVAGYGRPTIYVDANAVAPGTVARIGALLGTDRVVDACVIGPPAWRPDTTQLWASGTAAGAVVELFAGSAVRARPLDARLGSASALKACYGLQSKAVPALWLALAAAAERYGVREALGSELARDGVDLDAELDRISRGAAPKAWRWIGEMEEAAATMAAAGVPDGFSAAAAEIYRRIEALIGRDEHIDESGTVIEAIAYPPA
jgi:3-hydroxyisobutyrate dehydrogenase-like beta-hydroxyacid dehydrogenase